MYHFFFLKMISSFGYCYRPHSLRAVLIHCFFLETPNILCQHRHSIIRYTIYGFPILNGISFAGICDAAL